MPSSAADDDEDCFDVDMDFDDVNLGMILETRASYAADDEDFLDVDTDSDDAGLGMDLEVQAAGIEDGAVDIEDETDASEIVAVVEEIDPEHLLFFAATFANLNLAVG